MEAGASKQAGNPGEDDTDELEMRRIRRKASEKRIDDEADWEVHQKNGVRDFRKRLNSPRSATGK